MGSLPRTKGSSPVDRRVRLVVVAGCLALLFGLVTTRPAASEPAGVTCLPDDPYGCLETTTTLASGSIPTCEVSVPSAAVGARVDVTIDDVPSGLTVTLSLGGQVVDTKVSGASAAGVADVHFSFIVPSLPPGKYTLVATGAGFSVTCLPGVGFEVLANTLTQAPRSSGGSGGGSLARTGFTVLGLLLLAALLLLGGRVLVSRARRA
jgi:hypothetical protein